MFEDRNAPENRDKLIAVKFTKEEKALIEKASGNFNSVSDYVRYCILRDFKKKKLI